jgi:hypothetical protein
MGRAPTRIAAAEWDFSKPPLDDDEVYHCFKYEMGREKETEPWRDEIKEFRLKASGRKNVSQDKFFELFYDYAINFEEKYEGGKWNWPRFLYSLWPEWPENPFLSVSPKERLYRTKKWESLMQLRITEPLEVFPINKLIESYDDIRRLIKFKESETKLLATFGKYALKHHRSIFNEEFGKDKISKIAPIFHERGTDLVTFNIVLWENDNDLISRFRRWLSVRRSELKLFPQQSPEYRMQLKALGCWRLARAGFTANNAIAYTADQSSSKQPIYQTHQTFSKARKYAEQTLMLGPAKYAR